MCGNAERAEVVEREGAPECEGCGQPVEGGAVRVGRFDYCPECVAECDGCGETRTADEIMTPYRHDRIPMRALCPECRTECSHCGEELDMEDSNNVAGPGGDTLCGACYDNHYYTCEDCCDVIHRDDAFHRDSGTFCASCDPGDDDDEDAEDVGPIRSYHSARRNVTPLPSPFTRANGDRFFGVELEVERRRGCERSRGEIAGMLEKWANNQAADITTDGHRVPLLAFEEDGSLQDGFEMVTQPMGLDDQRTLWRTILTRSLVGDLRSHDTETCGLHVHVSRAGMTDLHISKVVCFVNDPDNAALVRAVARRYSTGYCRVERKRLASAHQSDGNRYQAVNLCNAHTLEFRIFRGSLHAPAVIAAVEFTNAVVEFCQPFGPDGFNLKAPAFLDFINTAAMRKHTRYLRAYLADRYPTACREAGLCDPALPADFVPVMMR